MINLVENIYDPSNRSNSRFFGNIMLRFFVTKKIKCPGQFNDLELLNLLNDYKPKNSSEICISKKHTGEFIEKNITVGGFFNYTTKFNIQRQINSPIGEYDNTGVPIIFLRKE